MPASLLVDTGSDLVAIVPGPANDVTIGTKGSYTVTSSADETVDSLIISNKLDASPPSEASYSRYGPARFHAYCAGRRPEPWRTTGSTCPIMTRDVKSRTSAPYPEATALRDDVSTAGCEVFEPGTERT
jgi:hypothetical protein